jgi:hypothetical protein
MLNEMQYRWTAAVTRSCEGGLKHEDLEPVTVMSGTLMGCIQTMVRIANGPCPCSNTIFNKALPAGAILDGILDGIERYLREGYAPSDITRWFHCSGKLVGGAAKRLGPEYPLPLVGIGRRKEPVC